MTTLQISLNRACHELGLKIVIPFGFTVRDSLRIDAQALLPQLGGYSGMIVVNRYDDLQGVASELATLGYGYSVLEEPSPEEEFDLASYVEMFTDWGWGSSTERKPNWMK